MALQRLKDAAEKAKCELSELTETEINLPFIISNARGEAVHLQGLLTRSQFEELSRDLVSRTIKTCQQALDEAGLEKSDINEVIFVGGMTRMPLVQREVAEFFEREPSRGVHPDEVVALGATIQGMALVEQRSKMILLDVTPHTLGIMVVGGYFEALIPLNTTVPTSRSKVFTTVRDNQTAVKIFVMQGESRRADENELLGEFTLTGLRPAPAGKVEIEVTFEIDADGIVSVHAKDLDTGTQQSITVTATSGLTTDEIKVMAEKAQTFLEAKRDDEQFEGAKQEAEKLIAQIEKLFPDVERAVMGSEFGRDAMNKARVVVDSTKTLIRKGETEALLQQIDALVRTRRMFKGVLGKTG
jgi:molecular chaperone DnaK